MNTTGGSDPLSGIVGDSITGFLMLVVLIVTLVAQHRANERISERQQQNFDRQLKAQWEQFHMQVEESAKLVKRQIETERELNAKTSERQQRNFDLQLEKQAEQLHRQLEESAKRAEHQAEVKRKASELSVIYATLPRFYSSILGLTLIAETGGMLKNSLNCATTDYPLFI